MTLHIPRDKDPRDIRGFNGRIIADLPTIKDKDRIINWLLLVITWLVVAIILMASKLDWVW